jgi:hypothetical protein
MYEQLHKQGKGNFEDTWYWSSSQYDSGLAWRRGFGSGFVSPTGSKDYSYGQVRVVRALP